MSSTPSSLHYTGGGTSFAPALTEAHAVMRRGLPSSPVLIFMSDGQDGGSSGTSRRLLEAMAHDYPGVRLNTVFFGSGSGAANLQSMVGGLGRHFNATNAAQLASTFVEVSMQCSLGEELERTFGEKISEQVAQKIVIDHL